MAEPVTQTERRLDRLERTVDEMAKRIFREPEYDEIKAILEGTDKKEEEKS